MKKAIYHVHALTAMHIGAGQGIGAIDLPFIRERATGLPFMPGSGLKGVWRDEYDLNDKYFLPLFGPEAKTLDDQDRYEGALTFGDGLLLCLPVRSLYGTFAWVTCPYALQRYRRGWADIFPEDIGIDEPIPDQDAVLAGDAVVKDGNLVLEELDLRVEIEPDKVKRHTEWAVHIAANLFPENRAGTVESLNKTWENYFKERFVIASDSVFAFLCETALEIRARVKLNDRKAVEAGPWYEENLPPESVMWGMLTLQDKDFTPSRAPVAWSNFTDPSTTYTLQIGGKATVGRGRVRWLYTPAPPETAGEET